MDNLLELLASPKQVGLLLGAGISKACGLPNIYDLTVKVKGIIENEKFEDLLCDKDNVETILSKLQQLKHLLVDGKTINELAYDDVQDLEKNIKKTIYDNLSAPVDYKRICNMIVWLNYINKDYEKEIFTLNYDLLLEKAMEELSLPYYTGFVGNVNPFFIPDSVDDYLGMYVKKSWIKLWKLHGSLNFKKKSDGKIFIENNVSQEYEDLLIYPSMDKYLSSRKAPYISYLDRFRKYVIAGEKVLVILGYSFSDEHINEIIINGLNNNPRLSILAFVYSEDTFNKCISFLGIYPAVSIYSDKKKYLNRSESTFETYKDIENIGDFNDFVSLLDKLSLANNPSQSEEESEQT